MLASLEKEEQNLEKEYELLQKEMNELDFKEKKYWEELNFNEMERLDYLNQLECANVQFELANQRLEGLKSTNVYNDAFKIWHDGPFGTINGLRLGRLPSKAVDWPEINASIGQMAFLLDSLAHKFKFVFTQYRILSFGSFSKIEKLDGDKAVYELYGSSDFTGMFFSNRRFDMGLVAFLTCLKEFGDDIEGKDLQFRLPYRYSFLTRISKDKIGEMPIRLQFNQDENWTKAMKFLLIDLKWLLSYCTSVNK
jgi:beclin